MTQAETDVTRAPDPATATDTKHSAHCAPHWPFTLDIPQPLARLHQANTAALTLSAMLHADLYIREEDDPNHKEPPLNPYHRDGLHHALDLVLRAIDSECERLTEEHARLMRSRQ